MAARPRSSWLVVLLAFAVPIAFAVFTDHAWEDYFITLRSSRHLVEGHGLVYQLGERVHTFTSPLGVLVPALCTWIAGPGHEEAALWLFRLLNASLLALAALLVWRRCDTLRLGLLGRFTLFGLVLADPKLTDFAINGMETAILVFFLLLLWTELESPVAPRPSRLGLALAGLMWTRPDAFILAGALVVARFVIRDRASPAPPRPWRPVAFGALLGSALYLPWFAWAWWYYGSPIPHTVVAKSAHLPPLGLTHLLLIPWHAFFGHSSLPTLFLPSYSLFGGWPAALDYVARALALVAAFAWLVPKLAPVARRLSLAVFVGMLYLCSIFLFPWYVPPWTVLAALALAFLVDHLEKAAVRRLPAPPASSRPRASRLLPALRIAAGLVVGLQLAVLLASAWQLRVQQRLIENDGRRAIGLWLRAHAGPRDTVFLEPLGYIGYYSQLKMYDAPGLSSLEVTALAHTGIHGMEGLIDRLRPTWLVLRPVELSRLRAGRHNVLRDYELVRVWSTLPALDAIRFLPGRDWLEVDSVFSVYRRRTP